MPRSHHSRSHFWLCPSKPHFLSTKGQQVTGPDDFYEPFSYSFIVFSVLILQLLRFGFTCFKKPRKDNMPISLSREIVVNLGLNNTAEVKMMPSSEKSHLDRRILSLTLSFSRFTTHLWASSAILAKNPMVVRFMTYHSHTSYGVNRLHNDANKCVSSVQAITSVKVFTMRLTKVTWRTVGSPLMTKESARRPVRLCVGGGKSRPTCCSTRDKSKRAWPVAQEVGTKD